MSEAAGDEYPKALYRDGGEVEVWGKPVRTQIVSSRDEEVKALASGWRLHPLAKPRPAKESEQ